MAVWMAPTSLRFPTRLREVSYRLKPSKVTRPYEFLPIALLDAFLELPDCHVACWVKLVDSCFLNIDPRQLAMICQWV